MELQAKVYAVLPVESGTSKAGKAWQKASIIAETPGPYPKKVKISNMKEAVAFAALPVGTDVTFHIEIESREWKNPNTGRTSWFTEVNCWKWEVAQGTATPPAQPDNSPYTQAQTLYGNSPAAVPQSAMPPAGEGDLPF